jgi:16S rRNA C967 or C1407 C5-methylase (RsmB/RsmF family)
VLNYKNGLDVNWAKVQSLENAQAFHKYFSQIYGDRWSALHAALLQAPRKTVLQNPFGLENYSLDAASVYPVENFAWAEGLVCADFCASPGGKSLAAIFAARGLGQWVCSDLSPARVKRLKAVLHDCLPPEVLARVRVLQGDASRWGLRFPEQFDRVLVDAPCSGERHLLEKPEELARWSAKGSKRLTVRQHALLCGGFDSLRPGGRLIYSTCSISPIENDGVIEKLLKSRKGQFSVLPPVAPEGEATEHGWILLPDKCGCGPIYFAVLKKVPSSFFATP